MRVLFTDWGRAHLKPAIRLRWSCFIGFGHTRLRLIPLTTLGARTWIYFHKPDSQREMWLWYTLHNMIHVAIATYMYACKRAVACDRWAIVYLRGVGITDYAEDDLLAPASLRIFLLPLLLLSLFAPGCFPHPRFFGDVYNEIFWYIAWSREKREYDT